MRKLLVVALLPLVAACSTMSPSASAPEHGGLDVSGRWVGAWRGTGLFHSAREESARLDFVQAGDRGLGRLIFEGAMAAESVPGDLRLQGAMGIRVVGKISGSGVTLRHELGGRLFTADLVVAGDRMEGHVRGGRDRVLLSLVREPKTPEPAPQSAAAPAVEPPAPAEERMVTAENPPLDEPEPAGQAPDRQEAVALAPAQPAPGERAESPAPESLVPMAELKPIHFDFDTATLRPDAVDVLAGHVAWLKEHADTVLLIEGHCDDRGTPEYNLALGERRAHAVKAYLTSFGISVKRLSITSYGKERPACVQDTAACRSQNRRAEFRVGGR